MHRRSYGCLLGAILLWGIGCSDDKRATAPREPRVIEVPGDAASLAEAIAAASRGDTVRVGAGIQPLGDPVTIDAGLDGLVVEGRSAIPRARRGETRPVLEASRPGATVIEIDPGASDVLIRGLELTGAFGIGVRMNGTNTTVRDCRIAGASSFAISAASTGAGRVERCLLLDAGLFGVHAVAPASVTVTRTTIAGAEDCGIFSSSAAVLAEQNVIYGSSNYGVACFGSPRPDLDCNVIFQSGTSSYSSQCVPGANDLEVDPLFCEETFYTLSIDSPCVDTGSGCGWIGAVEVVCEARATGDR